MFDFDFSTTELFIPEDATLSGLEQLGDSAFNAGNFEFAENCVDQLFEMSEIDTIHDNSLGGTTLDELENFNPLEGNDLYDSGNAMELWEFQGDTNRCAQYSQMFVIEEFTGLDLDPDAFCEFSEMNGWFDENGGTSPEDMNKMLDYFGIDNEMSYGNDINDLLNCLENNGRAIVALDSGEYWNGEGFWDDFFDPNGADHAVEVIGYNSETNSVILNDSGSPYGCGEEIPLDTFLDAWEDSGNLMIECYR